MQNELLKTICIIINYCLFTMRNNIIMNYRHFCLFTEYLQGVSLHGTTVKVLNPRLWLDDVKLLATSGVQQFVRIDSRLTFQFSMSIT